MLQQERKNKQIYLRKEVLEKNHDPEEFILFLNQKLNIESDIDRCTFQQLKDVVEQFLKEKQQVIVQKLADLPSTQSIVIKKDIKSASVIYKQYNPPVVQQEFESSFKCLKIIPKFSQETIKKMKCEISNPERKYVGGIFGIGASSFLQFQVKTFGVDWCVGRRYSDFIWLRSTLKKMYPSLIIPPIPNKKASKRTNRHIEKRMKILSYFINDLIKIPEIVNSRYLDGFLSFKEQAKFQNLKKQADSKIVFQNIASTETETGLVTVNLSNQNVNYFKQLKKFASKSEILYKQVTRASKKFQAQRIDEVNQLYDLGNKFAELYEVGRQFSNSVKSESLSNLNQIFIKLNNMMIEWGNNIKNEIDLLEVNFNTFFKYARESYMGFNQYFNKLDEIQLDFLTKKSELDAKKQRIFLFHDPNKWEIPKKDIPFLPKSSIHERTEAFKIMLPKESVEVQKIKTNYAFYLSRLNENSNFYFQKQVNKFNDNFNQFAIKNKVNNQQLGQNWNQMCYIFSEGNKAAKKLIQMQKIKQMGQSSNADFIDD